MSSRPPLKDCVRQHCVLSNGRFTAMLSDSGSGYSRWQDLAVTRWREDVAGDPWGSYLLLRDEDSGDVWSTSQQPYGAQLPDDVVTFLPGRATFDRRLNELHSRLDIAIACDADIELRRLTLTNDGDRDRTLSVTSYAEMVVGPVAADNAHPAYSKMFVQTDWNPEHALLLATRRQRSNAEAEIRVAQTLEVVGEPISQVIEYETDRARFLGRGRTLRNARAMQPNRALSNSSGCVLDPIFSLRRHVRLAPGAVVTLLLWTKLSNSRDGALELSKQLGNADAAETFFSAAATHAQTELKRLDIEGARGARIAHWLNAVLMSDPQQRPAGRVLAQGHGGPPVLWAAGISADRPILLQCLDSEADLACTHDLFAAQNLWCSQRLAVDVVLLNIASGDQGDALQGQLESLVNAQLNQLKAESSSVKAESFVLRESKIDSVLRNGLLTAARIVLG
ncbi:MAG: glycosyl transferase family 36, partial [Dokdonella sp.]